MAQQVYMSVYKKETFQIIAWMSPKPHSNWFCPDELNILITREHFGLIFLIKHHPYKNRGVCESFLYFAAKKKSTSVKCWVASHSHFFQAAASALTAGIYDREDRRSAFLRRPLREKLMTVRALTFRGVRRLRREKGNKEKRENT